MKRHDFLLREDEFTGYHLGFRKELLIDDTEGFCINDLVVIQTESGEGNSYLGAYLYFKIVHIEKSYKIHEGIIIDRIILKRVRRRKEVRLSKKEKVPFTGMIKN